MKRSFAAILAAILLSSTGCHARQSESDTVNVSDLYPRYTIVTAIDYESDLVTVCDGTGNLWQFYGAEDWQIDDICICIMRGNSTPEIYDDEIIAANYSGRNQMY